MTARPFSPTDRPYVGPAPIEDDRLFFGREREKLELANRLIGRRVILLHSPSGAGKTSLIRAGLSPEMQRQGFLVLPVVRVSRQPEPGQLLGPDGANPYWVSTVLSLEESLPQALQTPLSELLDLPLEEYLDSYRKKLAARDGEAASPRSLLVFDQFEEILTLNPADREGRQEFFGRLMPTLYNTQVWILVAMREDYIAGLEPYLSYFPERLNARFRLEYLEIEPAIQAVRQPAQLFGVDFEIDAARQLVEDLRQLRVQNLEGKIESRPGPYVEPVQLQVVCTNLWDARRPDPACISLQDVQKWGNVDNALAGYYRSKAAEAARSSGVDERRLRQWVERQLITEQGLRSQVLAGQEARYGLKPATVRSLSYSYLLREESRRGSLWYELAHDRLVKPVREDNAAWFRKHLVLLQRQADLWQGEGRPNSLLLQDADLEQAEAWAEQNRAGLTEDEQDLLERSQALRQEKQAVLEHERELRERELQAAQKLAEQERQRAEEQASSARRFRRLLIVAGVLFLALLLAGAGVALLSQQMGRVSQELVKNVGTAQAARALLSAYPGTATAAFTTAEAGLQSARIAREEAARAMSVAGTEQAKASAAITESQALQALADSRSSESNQRLASLLALLAQSFQVDNPELSALLAVEAFRRLDSAGTRDLLVSRLQRAAELELSAYSPAPPEQPFQVSSVAFGPGLEGEPLLAWGRADGAVILWDIGRGAPIAERIRHTQRVTSLSFSPDGRLLASGALNRIIHLWELDQFGSQEYRPPAIPSYNPIALAFSPDGSQLAAGAGATLFIYSSATLNETLFKDYELYPLSIAWNPAQAQQIAASDANGPWQVWDAQSGARLNRCATDCPSGVNYLAWSPDGGLLAAASVSGDVLLYSMPDGSLVENLSQSIEHIHDVSGLAFSHDGRYLAYSGLDRQLIVWDVARRAPVVQKDLGMPLLGVAFTPQSDGPNLVATVGGDADGGTVFLYETLPSNPLFGPPDPGAVDILPGEAGGPILLPGVDPFTGNDLLAALEAAGISTPLASLAIDPAMHLLAVVSQDGGIRVIDLENQSLKWSDPEGRAVDAPAFSPTGGLLAASQCLETGVASNRTDAGCLRSQISLWDAAAGLELDPAASELEGSIKALAFQPGGAQLLAGQEDGVINVISIETGQVLQSWQSPHRAGVTGLAFDPDGRLLVSAGNDGRLALWFADTWQQIGAPLTGGSGAIRSLRFDPTGKTVYTADIDGAILKWDLDPDSWVLRNCQQAGRALTEAEWEQYLPGEPYDPACRFPG